MRNTPLIVMCAPNGARLQKQSHASVPITAAELGHCASTLVDIGVSVLHMHVRDGMGNHSLDIDRYKQATDNVRECVGDKLIIQITTEAVGQYNKQQQMELVRALRPEAVSLALSELCPDDAAIPEAQDFFHEITELGIWPQYILYSPEEAIRFEQLMQDGVFGQKRPFVLFVLGRYSQTLEGDPSEIDQFLKAVTPNAFTWAVCCFGKHEPEAMRLAYDRGGHARLGFENNSTSRDGKPYKDNAELVRSELATFQTHPALASATDVREMFGIPPIAC